jgi:opacity protein-like surface antigen
VTVSPLLFSQVAPSAKEAGLPIAVGGGFSDFDVDWGHGRMGGGTAWIDWHPNTAPSFLHGFALEVEARDISLGGNSTQPRNYRLDTVGGGITYTWPHFQKFHPYCKLLIGLGGIDWNNPDPQFTHETRTVYASGGGFDYRVFRHVWARADYEYQGWPQIDLLAPGTHWLNPQGFTVGVLYDFRNVHSH